MRAIPILTAALLLAALPAAAHTERHFSAGEPGSAKKPARIVKVSMEEDGQRMFFEPSRIVVRKGEQIRFVMYNAGTEDHEFVLATAKENLKHAAAMKKNPHMAHRDPNAMTLSPFDSGELLWKFSKAGTFEFGCLIPGHLEAGMHGTVVVE
jgi:uncharacterized cupredoxin-like copper-binding protein